MSAGAEVHLQVWSRTNFEMDVNGRQFGSGLSQSYAVLYRL